ncbi:MAG: hypothetical protein AMS24_00925 [Chlamydiae bacterium SM23_39]|nr:MAG: hypothetical protein AMS24_00925 [Chlamydiae bacterium SM23_39]
MYRSWIEINLKKLKKNIKEIKKKIKNCLFCFPVKANAYGLGLINISKAAEEACVNYLGVSCASEAIELRKNGIKIPILILGAILEEEIEQMIINNIEFTISSEYKADLVIKYLKRKNKDFSKARVHIEVDTGMQRTGMKYNTAKNLFFKLKNNKYLKIVGIYTHLSTSDKKNDNFCKYQISTFKKLLKEIDPNKTLISHIANSSAVEYYPETIENMGMVRPGILTLGYAKSSYFKNRLEPCFSLKSKISFFKVVDKNQGISYGHTYKTKKQTRILTIPIGYGDGYRRILSNKADILIRGKRYPIVGNICMDQLMVNIGNDNAYIGDEVVLIGKQKTKEISLYEIAKLCNTIPYEILASFTSRIMRTYIR